MGIGCSSDALPQLAAAKLFLGERDNFSLTPP